MEIQFWNIKRQKTLAFYIFISFVFFISPAFADYSFTSQSSGLPFGSSDTKVYVDGNLHYVNKWENSSVIHNYFTGVYYDTRFWDFRVDWSSNEIQNVRIVASTGKCANGYGYQLWGYAKSDMVWFVDFDYNTDIFVYYCLSDQKLHWYAYSDQVGFQNFEGISFPIGLDIPIVEIWVSWTGTFVNNTLTPNQWTTSWVLWTVNAENSNFSDDSVQHDLFQLETEKENTFYIIK